MISIVNKEDCCGCSACYSICPKTCISMTKDEEGFRYPKVNLNLCINCGLCEKVCPIIEKNKKETYEITGIIARNKQPDILRDSTSGGVPSAIAKILFQQGYSVCGAVFDKNYEVVHEIAVHEEESIGFRGSKYVQSNLSDIFIQIKQKLISGEKVAFIGTPCQVEGLKKFLQEKYNNLFCIDFVCHGVPSPLIWNKYKEEMETKFKSHITGAKFRNKTYGYHSSTMSLMFSNGRSYNASGRIDPMLKAFFEELISRPSCHTCKFKSDKHISDLTLFDCKNYNFVTGKKDDDLGYTAVLIQSEKGYDILNQATIFLDIKKAEVEKLIKADGIMVRNSAIPNKQRELFWENIKNKEFKESLETVCKIGIKDVILEKTKVVLYKTGLLKLLHKLKK